MAESPVTVEDHLARILEVIEPLGAFPQPLMETLGLAAAEDVVSAIPLRASASGSPWWRRIAASKPSCVRADGM